MAGQIYVGDSGTLINITVKHDGAAYDISTVTTKTLTFERPDETTFQRTPAFLTDGSDGKLQYTTTGADFTASGQWKMYVTVISSSWTLHSTPVTFFVYAVLA